MNPNNTKNTYNEINQLLIVNCNNITAIKNDKKKANVIKIYPMKYKIPKPTFFKQEFIV